MLLTYNLFYAKTTEKDAAQNAANVGSVLSAGHNLKVDAGRDVNQVGSHIEAGRDAVLDAGHDLTITSALNNSSASSSSGSAGGGKGSGASDWTGEQTGIIGHEEVDIRVEGNTHIKGAVIGAENGNLTLDTGTLSYETVQDRDHGSQTGIGVGMGLGDAKESGFTPKPDSLEASYASHDKEGVLFPTVGEGSITVRDDPDADLSGLNRDLGHTRDITRNDEVSMDFYVSKQAVEEITGGFAGITGKLTDLANHMRALTAKLPEGCEGTGKLGLDAYKSMLREGVPDEVAEKILKDDQFQTLVQQADELAGVLEHTDPDLLYQKDASNPTGSIDPTSATIYYKQSPGESLITLMVEVSDFINSIPYQEERDAAMLAVQAVTGGPIKLAISYGVNLAIDYVAGDMIQTAKDTIFGTFVSYVAAGTSIEGLEEKAIGPNPTEELRSEYQASFDKTVQGVTTTTELVIGAIGALKPGKKPGHGQDVDHPLIPHNAEALFQELTEKGSKFSRDKIVAIEKMPDGKIVYLEKGNTESGLEHIFEHHEEFEKAGFSKAEIPSLIMRALREGERVGFQGKNRPIYALEVNGHIEKISITVSNNGYIVGANITTKKGRPNL